MRFIVQRAAVLLCCASLTSCLSWWSYPATTSYPTLGRETPIALPKLFEDLPDDAGKLRIERAAAEQPIDVVLKLKNDQVEIPLDRLGIRFDPTRFAGLQAESQMPVKPKAQEGQTAEALEKALADYEKELATWNERNQKVRDQAEKVLSDVNQQIWLGPDEAKKLFGYDDPVGFGRVEIKNGRATGAAVNPPDTLTGNGYAAHGWLGMGVGTGVILNAHHGKNGLDENRDILATFLTFRAYPFGKWFTNGVTRPSPRSRTQLTSGASSETRVYQRLCVVYGLSLAELTSDAPLVGSAHVMGLGWDISPEFTFVGGAAFFHLDRNLFSPGDSDPALFLGVTLNFDAYTYLLREKDEFLPN